LSGIKRLSQPDHKSRSRNDEGRRLVLIDPEREWGWIVVNYEKYKEMRSNEERREYMKEYMRRKRSKQPVNTVSPLLTQLAKADEEAEAYAKEEEEAKKRRVAPRRTPPTTDDAFWASLKSNPAYSHIDFVAARGKMQAWLDLPKNSARRMTRQFVLNWINKIDKPLGGKHESDWDRRTKGIREFLEESQSAGHSEGIAGLIGDVPEDGVAEAIGDGDAGTIFGPDR
jgi:hypothetical protein